MVGRVTLSYLKGGGGELVVEVSLLLVTMVAMLRAVFSPPVGNNSVSVVAFVFMTLSVLLTVFTEGVRRLVFCVESDGTGPSRGRKIERCVFFRSNVRVVSP